MTKKLIVLLVVCGMCISAGCKTSKGPKVPGSPTQTRDEGQKHKPPPPSIITRRAKTYTGGILLTISRAEEDPVLGGTFQAADHEGDSSKMKVTFYKGTVSAVSYGELTDGPDLESLTEGTSVTVEVPYPSEWTPPFDAIVIRPQFHFLEIGDTLTIFIKDEDMVISPFG